MHRVGYHFRQAIADRARETLRAEGFYHPRKFTLPGQPESIPEDQQEMFRQADAVLRDLFPRIPNTDRYEIVRHAFDKVCSPILTLVHTCRLLKLHLPPLAQQFLQWKNQGWDGCRAAISAPCSTCRPCSH